MLIKIVKIFFKIMAWTIGSGISILLLARLFTYFFARTRTFSGDFVNQRPVAVVFGAGLWRDGTPTPVLRDRVQTASNLYFEGKVQKILMSGDHRFENYNEPKAMYDFAVGLGVPTVDIILDYGGWRTYDTCYRLKEIYNLDEVILVTQNFHLPRALYTCNLLGVNALGVPADSIQYRNRTEVFWQVRETAATIKALWEIHLTQPVPTFEIQEPSLTNDGRTLQNGGNS